MNINLIQCNKLVKYGNELCENLKEKGYDVRLKPYTMYDGKKGLEMQVFDSSGCFFKGYYSGTSGFETMKYVMSVNAESIVREC